MHKIAFQQKAIEKGSKKVSFVPKCELFVMVAGDTVVDNKPLVSGKVSIGCR